MPPVPIVQGFLYIFLLALPRESTEDALDPRPSTPLCYAQTNGDRRVRVGESIPDVSIVQSCLDIVMAHGYLPLKVGFGPEP